MGVVLCGPAANKFILVEEGKFTSSKEAWENSLGELFPNGLMLMDGDQHKYHRSIMQEAFKKIPMQGYLDIMPTILANGIKELKGKKKVLAFPFFKNLTLKVAASVFFGLDPKQDLTGKDLFSRFCTAKDEEGNQFTDQEIIDHLIFVLMAAHDTTAITLTLMSYFLAKHSDWQDTVRAEGSDFEVTHQTKVKDLRALDKMGLVMKETLRIHPPLITVSRKLEREIEVNELKIPKNTFVSVVFQMTHHDERIWSTPAKFDPERFNKQRNEQLKCPFGYAPFGAGKHHCIGYQFAELMVKLGMTELLKRYKISVPKGYELPIRDVPLKQPKDNLPLYLEVI